MKLTKALLFLAVASMLVSPLYGAQSNEQDRKDAKAELKQQHKADKAQSKADKSAAKALGTKQAKKAAKDQDKANAVQPQ